MDNTFFYRRAGQELYKELAERTSLGHSSILLGMHGIGKTHCLSAVEKSLKDEDASHIIFIDFRDTKPVTDPAELSRRIRARIIDSVEGAEEYLPAPFQRRLLEGFEWLSRQPRNVVLLAANVDSLSHSLTQRVLREARHLVTARALTVIFTGEDQLAPLVTGDGSEFNCGQHYLIQGFDEPAYDVHMRARLILPGIPCPDPDACLKVLWEQTGGNSVIGRAALWLLHELQVRTGDHPELNPEMMRGYLTGVPVPDTLGMDAFHRISRVILRRHDCWKDLVCLINGEHVTVQPGGVPTGLEFAGLAVREQDSLVFASPVVKRIAKNYYDEGRLGDLFGSRGQWDDAFALYELLPPERRMRPLAQEDQARLELVVKSFTASFHPLATDTPIWSHEDWKSQLKRLRDFLARGCQLILGVRHVLFYTLGELEWEPDEESGPEVPSDTAQILLNILVERRGREPYERLLSEYGITDIFSPPTSAGLHAVVLLDGGREGAMAKNRLDLLEEILDEFRLAWHHLHSSGFNQLHVEQRKNHLAVATGILRVIGTRYKDSREAIQAAGRQMLAMGYRRIFFSLVDPSENCIRGFEDCHQEGCPPANFLLATDFPLNDTLADIQPWVTTLNEPLLIPDWRIWNATKTPGHPLINETLCGQAGTSWSFAVIPMRHEIMQPDGTTIERVIGTMHVERTRQYGLLDEDLPGLTEFASLMAVAIVQVEQYQAVKKALELDMDSIAVVTPTLTFRLVNDKAAKWLQLDPGQTSLDPKKSLEQRLVCRLVDQVRKTGKQRVLHLASKRRVGRQRHGFVRCSSLTDHEADASLGNLPAPPIGYVIEIRDLSPIERVNQALELVAAKASVGADLIEGVLDAVEHIGYKDARYYRVHKDKLVSTRSRGLDKDIAADFDKGGKSMTIAKARKLDTWRCLELGEPCIHQYEPGREDGPMEPTKHGLKRHSYKEPGFDFRGREAGHMWIDLPLFANGNPYGKIAIDIGMHDCNMTAEQFELLRLFSTLLGALLDGIERLDQKEQWARDATDKAVAMAAHHLRNQLSGMLGFYNRYEEAAPGNEKVKRWNSIFRPCFESAERVLTRTLDIFKNTLKIQPKRFRLRPVIEEALRSKGFIIQPAALALEPVDCRQDLQIFADAESVAIALEELITNSKRMKPERLQLQISARYESPPSGPVTVIEVKDNGPGVDPAIHDSAFDLLVSSNRGGKRGTGLGLAYVRRIAEAHGGSARFTSAPSPWITSVSLVFPFHPPLPPHEHTH